MGNDKGNDPTVTVDPIDLGNLNLNLGDGSSGSSGSAPPVDPTESAAESFYFQLWGRKAPKGYVKHFLNGEKDLFDFVRFQLSRPNADQQVYYRDHYANYAAQLGNLMGKR
jgi:hypothetical protein